MLDDSTNTGTRYKHEVKANGILIHGIENKSYETVQFWF